MGMKTALPYSILALALAYPCVLLADVLGLPLAASFDAVTAITLYVGLGLSLIISSDYEEKSIYRGRTQGQLQPRAQVRQLALRHS